LPGFEVTDAYGFYNNTSAGFNYTGFGVTLYGIPIPTKYDSPDIIYKFPLNYNNVDSSFAEYQLDIPSVVYSGGWKKRVNMADGWGELTTPFGTFDVIRIKTDIFQYDSIYIDSLGIGIPVYREYTEYKWLGNGFGIPLCEAKVEGFLTTVTYIDSVRNPIVPVDENPLEKSTTIFPNPSSGMVTVSVFCNNTCKMKIDIYSATGALIEGVLDEKVNMGHIQRNIDLGKYNLNPGLYVLILRKDEKIFYHKLLIW